MWSWEWWVFLYLLGLLGLEFSCSCGMNFDPSLNVLFWHSNGEAIEYGGAVLEAELSAWTTQESSPGEQEELWFYERWFDWSDMDEPPEIEEEEFLEVEEELLEVEEEEKEDKEAPLEDGEDGEEGTAPLESKEEEEEEEEEKEPLPKRGLRKIQEKIKRGTPSKTKSRKDRKVQEEEEEKKDRRHRWEGKRKEKEKQQEDRKTHRHKHGDTVPPLKEHKEEHPSLDKRRGPSKDEHGKGKGHLKHEKDPKGRKPWQIQKTFFPSSKDGAQRFGRHKSQDLKRHD